jgi:hypothetical protein
MKLWQETCEKLLSLKERKLNEITETAEHNAITDLRIEVAELQRNLGHFDEALRTLEDLPNSHDWLKKQFEQKCRDKDRMVFRVKYKNEEE